MPRSPHVRYQLQRHPAGQGTLAMHFTFALCCALIALPVFAHEEDDDSLAEVVVTAQKRAQSELDVPISMAVLGEAALEKRHIENLSDLAIAVPSLEVPARGGGGSRYIFLRGMSSIEGSTPLVGVYVDEASVTGFPGVALDLQTYDLERVEVLRGPQGTLYGVGSAGGTIRFITNDPDTEEFSARADTAFEVTRGGAPSEEVKSVLNAPLIDDKLGLRIAAVYSDTGGWIDQPALNRRNINDERLVNVRTKMLWHATDKLDIRASAIIHRANAGAPSTGEDANGNYTQAFDSPTTPDGKIDYNVYNITINQNLGFASLLSTSTYTDLTRVQHNVGYRVPFGTTPDLLFHALFGQDTVDHSFTQEIRLSSATAGKLTWSVGAFYQDAALHETEKNFEFGPPAAPFFFDIETRQRSRSWAVFGETTYALLDTLELGAGLRYFRDDQHASDLVAQLQQAANFHNVSPRFFVRQKLGANSQLYASAAKGFRSGGLAGGLGVRPFQPDTLWSYELGIKSALLDRRLNADVSIFYSDYKGVQVDSVNLVDGGLVQFTTNAGHAHIKGLDWDFSWRVVPDLTLGFTGELIDTRFVAINAIAASHAVGDPLDFIPKYHYSLWSNLDFKWAKDVPGFARLEFTQTGPEQYTNRTIFEGYLSHSDRINMLNASVGVDMGRWTASLYARNITNDRGYIDAEVIEQIAARARPRTLGVQFGIKL